MIEIVCNFIEESIRAPGSSAATLHSSLIFLSQTHHCLSLLPFLITIPSSQLSHNHPDFMFAHPPQQSSLPLSTPHKNPIILLFAPHNYSLSPIFPWQQLPHLSTIPSPVFTIPYSLTLSLIANPSLPLHADSSQQFHLNLSQQSPPTLSTITSFSLPSLPIPKILSPPFLSTSDWRSG